MVERNFEARILGARLRAAAADLRLDAEELGLVVGCGLTLAGELLDGREKRLAVAVESEARRLVEVVELVRRLLPGYDPAEWLRADNPGLGGFSPLETMVDGFGGMVRVRNRLRHELLDRDGIA